MNILFKLVGFVLIALCGCSCQVYEYNRFSRVKRDGLQFFLSSSILETDKRVIYGSPYNVYLSYASESKSVVNIDVVLEDMKGMIVQEIRVKNYINTPHKYKASFIFIKKMQVSYSNHFLKGTYTIKNHGGEIVNGVFDEEITFTREIDRFNLPFSK